MAIVPGEGLESALGVILGASTFPRMPSLASAIQERAFETSKRLVCAQLQLGCAEILDLFNAPLLPAEIMLQLSQFLAERPKVTDLVVYYVGHGGFLRSQEYFLAGRLTSERRGEKHVTGLRVVDLAATILDSTTDCRAYVILDSCFAATAAPLFQAAEGEVLASQLERLPTGIAVLAASSRYDAAIVPAEGTMTMFSEGLVHVLAGGIAGRTERLSLRQIGETVREYVRDTYPLEEVQPEVHSPRQRQGDPADHPFFRNAAYGATQATVEVRKTRRASTGTDSWLPPPGFSMRFASGDKIGQGFPVEPTGRLVIGRATDCDVVIEDQAISRKHVALQSDGVRILVENLSSVNRPTINGEAIDKAFVTNGDCLQLGDTLLVVVFRPPDTQ